MLTTAAVVTIVFRKLRIPTILGYIVAGFLIGPHFTLFMDIGSTASVETWSEIGVVIILFHIGLEFDFHKLSEIGSTAIVSAAVKMGGVMLMGYGFGILAGMNTMNAVFLGAMLSISSTVVIQKCFSEMGLEGERYTGLVMGSLVMEDSDTRTYRTDSSCHSDGTEQSARNIADTSEHIPGRALRIHSVILPAA